MGTLTRPVVDRLSALPSDSAFFIRTGIAYDYAIGGLPFLSGANRDRPIERQTADYRKQQFDASAEPGEQSMVFWWLRSQSSFHAGTGILYEEPDNNYPNNAYRFQDSLGVDPWTIGKLQLQPATYLNRSAANPVQILGCIDSASSTDMYLQAETNTLRRVLDGSSTTITWGGAGTILALADDGTNYFAADSTGIYKGTLAGGNGTLLWNTGSTNVKIGWVKQRLMCGIGPSIYDLSPSGGGTAPTLPTAKYTHPNPNWTWTAVAETPNAILAAGYVGAQSTVLMFTLNTSGDVPTLNSGIEAMSFPEGEIVYSLLSYLGDYVVVGTNKGVRIASVDATSGTMQYGPLSINSNNTPVHSLAGADRFIYAACSNQLGGNSGLWRLDMSTQVAFRKFAYATDLQTHVAGTVQSVGMFGASGRLVIAVDNHGSYLQDPNHLESTGWMLTGRIRFHTLEPKIFKYTSPRIGAPLAGSISMSVVEQSGDETTMAMYSTAGATSLGEAAYPASVGPQEFVAMRITLNRDGVNANTGPVVTGYQVKALPATKRQRTIALPLMCFDYEEDRYGASSGYEGSAILRLEALEALEEAGDLVLLQDLSRDPMATHLCAIDQVRFVQDVPPKNASGWGGYVLCTLRTVS